MGDKNNDNFSVSPEEPQSLSEPLNALLEQIPNATLKRFVVDAALDDSRFRENLLLTFTAGGELSGLARYRARLQNILQQYTNQDGFISAGNANRLNAALTALLEAARKPATPSRERVDVALAMLKVMPGLGERMEDAEGYLYSLMEQTCAVLREGCANLPPSAQQACFEQVVAFYSQPQYLDSDLDSFLLILLKEWAQQDKKRQTICLRVQETMLDNCADDQWRKRYLIEQTHELLNYWKTTA